MNRAQKTLALISSLIVALCLVIGGGVAIANTYFGPTTQTNFATSSPVQLFVQNYTNASSTIVEKNYYTLAYDSWNGGTQSVLSATQGAVGLLQFVGSTTASNLNISYEFSQDGIDWYTSGLYATSTLTSTSSISWAYSSTTQIGGFSSTSIDRRIVSIPTLTRFVRLVVQDTGATSTLWAQIVPIKLQ